jgi:hypothetical protein
MPLAIHISYTRSWQNQTVKKMRFILLFFFVFLKSCFLFSQGESNRYKSRFCLYYKNAGVSRYKLDEKESNVFLNVNNNDFWLLIYTTYYKKLYATGKLSSYNNNTSYLIFDTIEKKSKSYSDYGFLIFDTIPMFKTDSCYLILKKYPFKRRN